jgi:hypothetical protein
MEKMYAVIYRSVRIYKVICITDNKDNAYAVWNKQVDLLKKKTDINDDGMIMLFEVEDIVKSGIEQVKTFVGKTIKAGTEEDRIMNRFCSMNSGTTGTVIECFASEEDEVEEVAEEPKESTSGPKQIVVAFYIDDDNEFVEGEFAIKMHDDCSVLEDLLYEQGMIGVVVDETTLHPAEGAERSYTLYEWNDIPEHKYENYPSSEQDKADYVADWIGDDEDLF